MIVLDKDKVDERFNISDSGIITDLNGNIQKTFIFNKREYFKQQQIHRILMWTKYGYRDTKIWIIHHLDKNSLNNNINNLVFLTKSEHGKLHSTNRHLKFSEEAKKHISEAGKGRIPWNKGKKNIYSEDYRKKLSESHKGKQTWLKGKHLSEETKRKISESQIGRIPWNKGKKKGID